MMPGDRGDEAVQGVREVVAEIGLTIDGVAVTGAELLRRYEELRGANRAYRLALEAQSRAAEGRRREREAFPWVAALTVVAAAAYAGCHLLLRERLYVSDLTIPAAVFIAGFCWGSVCSGE